MRRRPTQNAAVSLAAGRDAPAQTDAATNAGGVLGAERQCPLCSNRGGEIRQTIAFGDIWSAYAEMGVRFSADLLERHTPAARTQLIDCTACGLGYFAPAAPGEAEFYRELMEQVPYVARRWEFEFVRPLVRPTDAVVDLGCGDGHFLRSLQGRARRLVGADHNPAAAAALGSLGIEHFGDFDTLANREPHQFDVVCMFQVLEHLPSAMDALETAVRCLSATGRLYVAVPNRARWTRTELEPMDCPPHHLSRWTVDQLASLAGRLGLRLAGIAREEPDRSAVSAFLDERFGGTLKPILGQTAASRIAKVPRRLLVSDARYARWATSGEFTRRGLCGHTIIAVMERSVARSGQS